MSDFYRNNPPRDGSFPEEGTSPGGPNRWQQADPFVPYDDPAPAAPGPSGQDDFSAWRRPDYAPAPAFLSEPPLSYGAEMQQGGVPLYEAEFAGGLSEDAGDAPTRIGMPLVTPQMVNRRKSVVRDTPKPPQALRDEPLAAREDIAPVFAREDITPAFRREAAPAPAQEETPSPRRAGRVGRMARYHESRENEENALREEGAQAPGAPQIPQALRPLQPVRETAPASFDPFAAGDGEAPEAVRPPAQALSARRPADPAERYTGARTALPRSGAPVPRSQVGALPDYDADEPAPRPSMAGPREGYDPERAQSRGPQNRMPKTPAPQSRMPREEYPGEGGAQELRRDGRPGPDGRPYPDARQNPVRRPDGQGYPQSRSGPDGRPGPEERLSAEGRSGPDGRPYPDDRQNPVRRPSAQGYPQGRSGPDGRPGPNGRIPPDGRPVSRGPQDRPQGMQPRPQSRMPMDMEEDSERYEPSGRNPYEEARGKRRPASTKRPRYEFEDEDEEDYPRRAGCLVPILIVLLVIGGLLAGICLPNWSAEAGGIQGTLASAKGAVTGLFDTVRGMVFPQEDKITQFSVVPAEGAAPVSLVFNVQTSNSITELRVVDDQGREIVSKAYSADSMDGDVTRNSKGMIWTLRHTMEEGYNGLFTVQARDASGEWDEGMPLSGPVAIEPPPVAVPPVANFTAQVQEPTVPASVAFTVQTSSDVAEVRIVDDYNQSVVAFTLGEAATEAAAAQETADGITWDLTALISEPYEGSYHLQYRTMEDVNFSVFEESSHVDIEAAQAAPSVVSAGDLDGEGEEGEEDGEDPDLSGEGASLLLASADTAEDMGGADGAEDIDGAEDTADTADTSDMEGDTPEATPAPEVRAEATVEPAASPLPKLSAQASTSAAPEDIKLKASIFSGDKSLKTYTREKAISLLDAFNYSLWRQSGVLTFRGGPLRQNAAYGTADITEETLEQLWDVPVGSTKLSKTVVYGVVWPGQPAIVKWATEPRSLMNMHEDKRTKVALKEVILSAQDGLIYFLDLADGKATRDPIDLGAPSSGGVSVATNGIPMLGVGQSHGNLASKQVDNGYHLINLVNNKEILLVSGRDKAASSSYTGASGAAIFDKDTGAMIFGGQNGVLYTVELGTLADTFDYYAGKISIGSPAVQKYKTLASKQDKKNTNIDGSVAMYGDYVYYGDEMGVLQCVDVNTLTPVWAVKTDDNIDATPALDMEEDGQTLALYTANSIKLQGKKGVSTIRRYDALTGDLTWAYEVPDLVYTTEFLIGCIASPVVGEKDISDLVIFTVTNGKEGSRVIALNKASGSVAWTQSLESESLSSPVAVYNDAGKAWIIQAEANGNLHLMDGKTGEIKSTLQLEGEIEASPAVYQNILVIGTTGKDTSYIYGVQIK